MHTVLNRVIELAKEIENFPIGSCSPSDDPDKITVYVYGFRQIVKRFLMSAKRIENAELRKMMENIDDCPESIYEAYDLHSNLLGVIDFIKDIINDKSGSLVEKKYISNETANNLMNSIITNLSSESANNLPIICNGYGLLDGTVQEAFKSKKNYVYSRIATLSSEEILILALKLKGKYPESQLDRTLNSIYENEDIGVITKFDDIKQLILSEIEQARFIIWVAVAWFTDKDLANKLYIKSKQGVNIQIILNDDEINENFSTKLEEYFEIFRAPKGEKFNKLMHHKFCVIDFKKVIHGSYNWTIKAQYNNETISLIEDRNMAESFAEEFLKIKTEIMGF